MSIHRTHAIRCLAGLLLAMFLGCERQIPLVPVAEVPINGYQIEGTMLDGLKRPLVGVSIRMYYDPTYVGSDSVPNRSYTPQAASELVLVRVYDSAGLFVKLLFQGTISDSSITILWDGRNGGGAPAPSGLYTVRYSVGSEVRTSYPVIVDGNVTAVTDTAGHYTIGNTNLPIGSVVPYLNGTTFLGWYRIDPSVFLEVQAPSLSRTYHIALEVNVITEFSLIIE